MKAKTYLRQIRILDAKINNLQSHADELRDLITASGGSTDGVRVMSSPSPDPMADKVVRYVDMTREIDKRIDELIDLKHVIVLQIDQLSDARYITLLKLRYVDLKTWEQIAVDMNYTVRRIYQLHGAALQAFEKRISLNFIFIQ